MKITKKEQRFYQKILCFSISNESRRFGRGKNIMRDTRGMKRERERERKKEVVCRLVRLM